MPIIINHRSASKIKVSLIDLFKPYGEIEVYQIEQNVGIEFKSKDSLAEQRAVNELQNLEFQGQPLELKWVKAFPDVSFPPDPDPPSGGG